MRKLHLIVGVLAMGVSSLQAGSIASGRTTSGTDCGTRPQRTSKEVTRHMASCEKDEIVTSFSVDAIMGVAGPANTYIAQDGYYGTAATTNPERGYIDAEQNFTPGVRLGFHHSGSEGQNVFANYTYMRNTANKKGNIEKGTTYTSLISTQATNAVTGASAQVTKATGNYGIENFSEGKFGFHMPIHGGEESGVMMNGMAGIVLGYMDHFQDTNYTMQADSKINKIHQRDEMTHGGLMTGFVSTKCFGNFGIEGSAYASYHLASTDLTYNMREFTDETTEAGFVVRSGGSLRYLFPAAETSMGLFYSKELENGGSFVSRAAWTGGTRANSTTLFSNVSGAQSRKLQSWGYNFGSVGIAFTY